MARRRTRRMAINQKLIVDTIGASLIVQKAPALINQFLPLDPMIAKVAGVGAGWLTGNLLKRPDISNVSLALGVVELLTPMFDNLLGGGTMLPAEMIVDGNGTMIKTAGGGKNIENIKYAVSDYGTLNDYTNNPGARQSYSNYRGSYTY